MKSPKQIIPNSRKLTQVRRDQTRRLIPYRYSDRGRPILDRLAQGDDDPLSDLTELEGATNDRLLGESGGLPGVSALELVSGFPLAHIVNTTFTHTRPSSGRFNSSARGAWYSSFEMATAQREVAFHRGAELKEIGWKAEEVSPYIDYLADFRHEFHGLREEANVADWLDANSYSASQALGIKLLTNGSAGIVYPSVRCEAGVCIACFRPLLVLNVREGAMIKFSFVDTEMDSVEVLH